MLISEEISNIILSVSLIATFIGVFFFTYGSWVEKQVIEKQMDYIIRDLVGDIKIISPSAAQMARSVTNNLQPPNMQKQDMEAKEHNEKLLKKALIVLGIVFTVGILTSFILSRVFKFSYLKLLLMNFITLLSVAVTEFCFLTFFGKNYKSADPNVVRKAILQTLKSYSNN